VAIVAVLAQVPLALAGSAILGLEGLALSLAPSTWFLLAALLSQLHALGPASRRLLTTATFVALLAAIAFVPTGLAFGPYVAVVLGIGVYIALLAALRSLGLRASWRYLRSLA